MILGKVAKPANGLHIALITIMVCGMAFCTIFMPDLFGINSISGQAAMLLVVFLIATEALFRYIYKFTSLCGRILNRRPRRKKNNINSFENGRHGGVIETLLCRFFLHALRLLATFCETNC